jgi:uncharacterized protein YndB with AHSA1/START domain
MTETALAPVVRAVHVRKPAEEAFRIFTERIGDWWPLQRHGLYAEATAGVRFADGRVVERSTAGEDGVWAEVTDWDPPRRLALSWHPGTDPAVATVVEVDFEPDEDGTRVVLTHSGWEVLGERAEAGLVTERRVGTRRLYRVDPDGLTALRAYLDGFWDDALTSFQRLADEAEPPEKESR